MSNEWEQIRKLAQKVFEQVGKHSSNEGQLAVGTIAENCNRKGPEYTIAVLEDIWSKK